MPDVREVVRELRERGYRMAVASSSPPDYIEYCTEDIGVRDCFSVLFSGRNALHPKPAPDTFLMALEKLGGTPDECVVVEDSENGSKAARTAGPDGSRGCARTQRWKSATARRYSRGACPS